MATVVDTFSTAGVLTTPWTNQSSPDTFTANGTTASPTNLNNDTHAVYNGGVLSAVGADQFVRIKIGSITGGGVGDASGIGIVLRWSPSAVTGYRVVINGAATSNLECRAFLAGATAVLAGTVATQAFAAGDWAHLQVSGTAPAISLILRRAPVGDPTNFSQTIWSITDDGSSTIIVPASGFPGMGYSSTITTATIDEFIAGDGSVPVLVTWEQEGYLWRRDDGSETTATTIGAQDTPL